MATAAKMTGSVLGQAPAGTRAVMSGSTLTSSGPPPIATRAVFSGSTLTSPGIYVIPVGRYRYNLATKTWVKVTRYRFNAAKRLWQPVEWGANATAAIPGGQGPSDAYLDPYSDGHVPTDANGTFTDTYTDIYSDAHGGQSISSGTFKDTYLNTYTDGHTS